MTSFKNLLMVDDPFFLKWVQELANQEYDGRLDVLIDQISHPLELATKLNTTIANKPRGDYFLTPNAKDLSAFYDYLGIDQLKEGFIDGKKSKEGNRI